MAQRFVILDRDGTIIEERHYLSDPDQVELIPGVREGLRQLSDMGLGLVVVSNQSGVGRGFFDRTQVDLVNERMCALLGEEGIFLQGIYYCPHVPEEHCRCRKPESGFVEQAAEELGFDPQEGFVIGDKACDVELGHRIGATTFWICTGNGLQVDSDEATVSDFIVDSIWEAVSIISSLIRKDVEGNP